MIVGCAERNPNLSTGQRCIPVFNTLSAMLNGLRGGGAVDHRVQHTQPDSSNTIKRLSILVCSMHKGKEGKRGRGVVCGDNK
jgi:hypothetical protein